MQVTCSRHTPSCSEPCASASRCSAGTSGFGRACIRPRPSQDFGRDSWDSLFWNICTRPFLAALSHWVALGFSATLRPPAVGHALFHGFLGPGPCLVSLWVLGSQPLTVLLSSRPFDTCFIQHSAHPMDVSSSFLPRPMISIPTSPSESLLLFNPWNELNSDAAGIGNTQASQENANHHLPRTPGCPLHSRCTESVAPPQC